MPKRKPAQDRKTVTLRSSTWARLTQAHQGFGDSLDAVVNRALDALERQLKGGQA